MEANRHGGRYRHYLLALALAALSLAPAGADVVEQGPKDSAPSGLLAGVARADITPPVGIAQLNWGSQTHIYSVGNDPAGMVATALVLANGGQKFVMVDVDALLISPFEPAIDRAARETGIPASHIRLAATHTHAGPNLSAAKGPAGVDLSPQLDMIHRYQQQVVDKIVGIIIEANANLKPAHIFGGRGEGSINVNRRFRANGDDPPAVGRNPDGLVDRELVVFRIDDASGKTIAVLANYQCHGTVLAYENKYISPDWPGMTRKVIEQAFPGALSLFFQGAAGNQGPIEGFTGDLGVAHRLGSILGHQAAAVALEIETVRREPTFEGFVESTAYQAKQHWRVKGPRDATLKLAHKKIDLPRRTYTNEEISAMTARVEDAKRKLAAAEASGDDWKKLQAGARVRRFGDLLHNWTQPPDPSPVQLEVRVLRIGEVCIVSMPGEQFAEIGQAIKRASPFKYTMYAGYSSGEGGDYMPTDAEYSFGGYEIERTPYGKGAADKLIRETIAMFEDVK
ncbi:MAG TPA: neutral/alkaline non-lysosomal ceramidase N-terminal domain-containing protein [Bryobacterales bacterium]|nr:neutral/alkaline non-lysosomal ceramidase N-terminal domain-containing protein [Bryobacterales bacterium]